MAKERKLSDQQETFCKEYLIDMNATQAAIRAKYSKKTANAQAGRLLVNVSIQNRIRELMEEKDSALIASADEVLEYFTSVMHGEIHEEVLTEFGTVEVNSKIRDRTKAAELLGKRHGLFSEKIEIASSKDDPTGLLTALEQTEEEVWNGEDVPESVEETETDIDLVAESQIE